VAVPCGGGDGADWSWWRSPGLRPTGLLKSWDFRSLLFGNSIAARLLRGIEPILPNPAAAGATAHGQRQQKDPGNCKQTAEGHGPPPPTFCGAAHRGASTCSATTPARSGQPASRTDLDFLGYWASNFSSVVEAIQWSRRVLCRKHRQHGQHRLRNTLSRVCRKPADDADGADGADAIWLLRDVAQMASQQQSWHPLRWLGARGSCCSSSFNRGRINRTRDESSPATHLERGGGDADCWWTLPLRGVS